MADSIKAPVEGHSRTFWQPILPTIADLGGTEEYIPIAGSTILRCAHFPSAEAPNHTVVILPGRTEFIEKYLELVDDLTDRGNDVWVLDWRGQGLSERPQPNRQKGHIHDFNAYVDDLAILIRSHIHQRSRAPITLLGHSTGSLIALLYLYRTGQPIAGAVLVTPMTKIEAGTPFKRALLGLFVPFSNWSLLGTRYMPGFGDYRTGRTFANNPLTSDENRFHVLDRYFAAQPKLAVGGPTLRWYAAGQAAIAEVAKWPTEDLFDTPTLIICAKPDQVVGHATQRTLAARLPNGSFAIIEGARHEIMMEQDRYRNRFLTLFDDFIGAL